MKTLPVLGLPRMDALTTQHPRAISLGMTFLLLLIAAVIIDYYDPWRKRRALRGIPIVGDGNYCQHSTGGKWPMDILDRLPRLENFVRERVRCDTTSVFTATRRLQKPVRLESIGRTLDRGSFVAMPAQWFHQRPDIYAHPNEFHGCRFYDPLTNRCQPRAATADRNFLAFGYGAEMCPGRGVGMRQAQLAFAKILLAFDIDSYPVRGVKTPNKTAGPAVTLDRVSKLQWRRRSPES